MNAAERLFLDQGVAPTTIEQITSAADVAKGTFYLYFSSKDDVLASLSDRFAQQLLGKIQAAVAGQPVDDWKGKLESWTSACANGYLDAIRLHDILFYGSRPASREALVDNTVIHDLAALLEAGTHAKAWLLDDSHFSAVFLFNGVHAVVDDAYVREKRVNRTRLSKRLEEICSRAAGVRGSENPRGGRDSAAG
ncbi:MAG TPA: TetR/AcrR family transcriptional regulator [Bryobacteraceae bacterium]|jgi:AcrR family transcriptional regulator|nr:TetR/AcrR family transcriptional regulator [Bryobacteraceae bacterium]